MNQQHSPSEQVTVIPDNPDTSAAKKERSIAMRENRLKSSDLFTDSRELLISHGEDTYRLRLTAQNKLILTK